MSPRRYDGAVVFVQGVHYPIGKDDEPNLDRPLRWDGDHYRDADEDEALHNDANHLNDLELDPGGEG